MSIRFSGVGQLLPVDRSPVADCAKKAISRDDTEVVPPFETLVPLLCR